MATTLDPYADNLAGSGQRLKNDASHAAGEVKHVATDEIRKLIADVEDLVARLADLNDGEVSALRNKVLATVDAAKETLSGGAETIKRQAQRAFVGADDYVRESPWVAIGLAAVVGAVAGILVARRS